MNKLILYISLALIAGGCDNFSSEGDTEAEDSKIVARVHEVYLTRYDLAKVFPKEISAGDSAQLAERYINNWVHKQLLIAESAKSVPYNQEELERKVQDYRNSLLIYEYEKQFVQKNLSKDISQQEVEEYYNENEDNFQLKQNIIRGVFLKVPKNAPKLGNLRQFADLKQVGDIDKLKSYAHRFATDFMLEDSVWINFDELIAGTPLSSIPNKVQWLRNNKYVETSDDDYLYFLNIKDYKISDELSPLEFVQDQIEAIILNKRKTELAARHSEEIYEKARKNNEFEIYVE